MLVVDASVAIKFVTEESGSAAAVALLASPDPLIAPDWVLAESASGLARKVLLNGLPLATAEAALAALPRFFSQLHPAVELLDSSFDLSFKLRHAFYDCLYLALALRDEAMLVTADAKFEKAARRGGFGSRIRLLDEEGYEE
ncbi:MAG TPA: type II toxin-antitoxin system VapC family toxin [Allosphingosinicella sp.]|nr:type II toxin-antitoxin system VapC family toxin [Allosphingosinicella sp.]